MKTALIVLAVCTVAAGAYAAEDNVVYYYDLNELNRVVSDPIEAEDQWDLAHLATSLQGIVNRDAPRLFLRVMPHPDDFWWRHLREEHDWPPAGEVKEIDTLEQLLQTFRKSYAGLVVYDPRVNATSNLASTIAGVESRLAIRYDDRPSSLYQRLKTLDLGELDEKRLMSEDGSPLFTGEGTIPGSDTPSTGSAKCDAYIWAKENYLDAGKCDNDFMAYYIDQYWFTDPDLTGFTNCTLFNHDFYISRGAFFLDLHVWEDEAPVDDPDQEPGTDVATFRQCLRSQYYRNDGEVFMIGGFIPFAWKYTDFQDGFGKHSGVPTEWKYSQVISEYNAVKDADALGFSGMVNASFYQHFPLETPYEQNPRPTVDDLREEGLILEDGRVAEKMYVMFYLGDYDSAAWINFHMPLHWQDPAHGAIPHAWAINPNHMIRAPHVMHYVRSNATENDWFIAGDNGAGYLNPSMLYPPNRTSGLPDGTDAWIRHNQKYYRPFDLSITGFVIDGHAPWGGDRVMEMYQQFSPDGVVFQQSPYQGLYEGEMPYIRMRIDLISREPELPGHRVYEMAGGPNWPKFMVLRTILKSPTYHKTVMEIAQDSERGDGIVFLDPYRFFLLLEQHESNKAQGAFAAPPRETISFTAGPQVDGLGLIAASVSPVEYVEAAGRPAFAMDAETQMHVAFEAANGFCEPLWARPDPGGAVRLTMTVRSAEGAEVAVSYDGVDTIWAISDRELVPAGGEWTELTFDLPNAYLGHRENFGGDIRLVVFEGEADIHKIRLER